MKVSLKRRPPTIEERLRPCEGCNFPLSHRHHVLPFSEHGEHPLVHSLCAACHDTIHLMLSVHYKATDYNKKVWEGVQKALGIQNERLNKLLSLAWEHIDLIDDVKFTHLDIDFDEGVPFDFEIENTGETSE